ncbi:MAG: hypothetical protein DCF16_18565 [Alphaproteobacteria bacterium]|nr:MAG: hypothetical protein DCF16_18565 [Alphaproteobacteria bacterium]
MKTLTADECNALEADLLITACGYEPRSTTIAKVLGSRVKAHAYIDLIARGDEHYESNKNWYEQSPAVCLDCSGVADQTCEIIVHWVAERAQEVGARLSLAVDVSSFTGSHIAYIMEAVGKSLTWLREVSFMYVLSEYVPAPLKVAPVTISRPASSYFVGDLLDAARPCAVVVGLGYEPGRAIGCLDYFEPAQSRLFVPRGPDARFIADIRRANVDALAAVGPSGAMDYDPLDPLTLVRDLDSVCLGLAQNARVVLVPMGPKIFRVACCLVSMFQSRRYCVWRASGGSRDQQIPRKGTGVLTAIQLDMNSLELLAAIESRR